MTTTHINELRTALNEARTAIGMSSLTFTTLTAGSSAIQASDFTQLRDGTQ